MRLCLSRHSRTLLSSRAVKRSSSAGSPNKLPGGSVRILVAHRLVSGGQIVLHWAAGGLLQKAEQVDGPWTDVEGVTSPHVIPLTKLAEFFRIK